MLGSQSDAFGSENPDSWVWLKLTDACAEIVDCPHSTPKTVDDGPWLMARTQDIRSGVFRSENALRVDEEVYFERIAKAEPTFGDLIFSREGTYFGTAAEVPSGLNVCLGQRMVLLRPDSDKAHSRYLRYWLNSPVMQKYIAGLRDGSVAERLNMSTIRSLPVLLPPVYEQELVIAALSPLDEKIELNRQMNRTLEEIAQTLFRAWFVDFEGESDLVESELGPIPRGWEVVSLGEIADNWRDTLNPDDIDPETPYIGLGDLVPQTITSYTWGRAKDASSTKMGFEEGDLMFGKLRPYFKKVIVAPFAGVCSSDMLVLRPREPPWFGYLLGLLTLDTFIDFCDGASTGTRMPRVNWKTMSKYPIAVPEDRELVQRFSDLVAALVARINHNIFESINLTDLRDTLLPKLISGEIRIPEAEELAREAV